MELIDVIQYAHKIKKIKITNKNKQSKFSYVIIKITLPTRDDEIIRFSLNPNDSFLEHQTKDNDFYQVIYMNMKMRQQILFHFIILKILVNPILK